MKELNDLLLSLFTGNDELRPKMMFPNLENGRVCATDSHVAISIPESEVTLNYQSVENFPNVQKVIDEHVQKVTTSVRVKVSDIAKELAKARFEVDKIYRDCSECDGSGNVDWEYSDKKGNEHSKIFDCPVCDGKGTNGTISHLFARVTLSKIEDDGFSIGIHVGDLYFAPFQLYRLFMVALLKRYEEIEIFYNRGGYSTGTITHFGEVTVLVMTSVKP